MMTQTNVQRPIEYRAPAPDPAAQERALWVGAAALVGIVLAATALEARTPGPWPIFVGWAAIVAVIASIVMIASQHRARRAYAATVWRLSDRWIEMRSPSEWVRIARHQVERISPAPDGIIVYAGERVVAVPDAVEHYDELRTRLLEWLADTAIEERMARAA